MPHEPVSPLTRPEEQPDPAMSRASYFTSMSFSRFARLLSDRELYHGRQQQCSETFVRCFSFLQFCCCSLCSLVTVMTPWMLSAAELIIMMILYFAVVPDSVDSFTDSSGITEDNFSMKTDLKDVLIISVIRVSLLSVSYGLTSTQCSYKPYYFIAWMSSILLVPYAIVRAAVSDLRPLAASLSLILTLIAFSIVHVIVAHATMKRLQRRLNMGLLEFASSRWKEEDWVIEGRTESSNTNEAIAELLTADGDDVPRDLLADSDSKYVDCDGLSIHYKEERPTSVEEQKPDCSFAILLIHGFGGGVFSWRNIMKPLAETCGCRVVAFDRPAFGLTDRPRIVDPNFNPYKLQTQQTLILEFCKKLEIKKVMLIGHSDGCVLALMLGASLNPLNTKIPQRLSESARKMLRTGSVRKPKGPLMIGMNICRRFSVEEPIHPKDSIPESGDLETGEDIIVTPRVNTALSILGMVFLHPDLSRDDGHSFANILRQSKVTRKVLRPLLRSDIGEVCNRRAWYDASKLTKEILDLYKAPLRIRGWDSALVAYTKEKKSLTHDDIRQLTLQVIGLPLMVLTGEQDRVVPPDKAIGLAEDLHAEHKAILPNCGHLSHEEVPDLLKKAIVSFVQYMYELYEDL